MPKKKKRVTINKLRLERERAGLSREAACAQIGISFNTLAGYESESDRRKRVPRFDIAVKMAAVYGCTITELACPTYLQGVHLLPKQNVA